MERAVGRERRDPDGRSKSCDTGDRLGSFVVPKAALFDANLPRFLLDRSSRATEIKICYIW